MVAFQEAMRRRQQLGTAFDHLVGARERRGRQRSVRARRGEGQDAESRYEAEENFYPQRAFLIHLRGSGTAGIKRGKQCPTAASVDCRLRISAEN